MSYLVVCPFPFDIEVALDRHAWAHIIFLMRSYGPVCLLGHKGQWMDSCSFTENEILSECTVEYKVHKLQEAALVVGVANLWLMTATALEVPTILLYPHVVPRQKWFRDGTTDKFASIGLETPLMVPSLLAALRVMISRVA